MKDKERIAKLQLRLKENGIDAYLVTQNVDIYYLCGSMQTGMLFIPANGEPVFYVKRSITRAEQESIVNVKPLGSWKEWGASLLSGTTNSANPVLAVEMDALPVQTFERLRAAIPNVRWQDGSKLIRELRMVKDEEELEAIRVSARAVDVALREACNAVREGWKELEFVATIEYALRIRGHMGLMRMRAFNQELVTGMVAAGSAASTPTYFDGPAGGEGLHPASPQGSGTRPIGRGEPILIDIGCCIDGYVIDQTRTAVIGELPHDLKAAYQLSEQVLRVIEAELKPGVSCESIYALALDLVKQAGLSEHFMGFGPDQVKFVGHGIGMEIDEWPVLARGFQTPLAPGMVLAIEPKFTFPGRGVVGIENTYAITKDGFEKLTVSREGIWELQQ